MQNLQRKVKIDLARLNRLISMIPACLKVTRSEVGVVLVGTAKIRELNRKFLQNKSETDILCFAPSRNCGELVICAPVAKRQAGTFGHCLEEELLYLIIHGLLHLAGYRDYDRKCYFEMKKRQDKIFTKILRRSHG